MNQKKWICLGLLVLTLLCFGHVCFGDFIAIDDNLYVTDNPHVVRGLSWTNVAWAFTDSCYTAGYWIPLTFLSLQLDATLFGSQTARGFLLINLLLHAANVVLFFLVLNSMTGAMWPSAMAAALYAVHPLRVESVAWVTERKDVLSTLFLLLAVAAYYRYTQRPTWRGYGLAFAVYFLGLMAKPSLVTLPFGLLLLDYWPLYRLRLGQTLPDHLAKIPPVSWRRLVLEKIPFLVPVPIISLVTMHFSRQGMIDLTWNQRGAVALSGYLEYLVKTVWPTNLAVLYPFRVPGVERVMLAAAVLGVITAVLVYLGRKQPALVVGWFWFLGTMFPVSGVLQTGTHGLADRFTYVPHLGFMVMVVWGLYALPSWRRLGGLAQTALVCLVVVGLGVVTWRQVLYWRSTVILFTHTLDVTENNFHIHFTLSGSLHRRGQRDLADYHMARALQIVPDDAQANLIFGSSLVDRGLNKKAIPHLQLALQKMPDNSEANYFLGAALTNLGRWEEAQPLLQRAIELWTPQPTKSYGVGNMTALQIQPHLLLCQIFLRDGNPSEALAHALRALDIDPNLHQAWLMRGIALGRLDRWAEAEQVFLQAKARQPKNLTTWGYLAFSYARQGQKDRAAGAYADLAKRYPEWAKMTNGYVLTLITKAWLLDTRMAEEMAWQLCEASDNQDPRWLDTLAAVQAAAGDFGRASATANKALGLGPGSELTRQLRDRLQLYDGGRALPITKENERD